MALEPHKADPASGYEPTVSLTGWSFGNSVPRLLQRTRILRAMCRGAPLPPKSAAQYVYGNVGPRHQAAQPTHCAALG